MAQPHNLVIGLGKTGVSVVHWLAARGERVTVCDSRPNPPGREFVRSNHDIDLRLGLFDVELLTGVDRVILSPGVSRQESLVQHALARQIPVIGDIQLFADACVAPILGVTGTNGKSTVTTLVAAMLSAGGFLAYAGGNLGEPALDLLSRPRPDFYVLELSSYQLESTQRLPLAAAAVLNVTPDHMDRYPTLSDYAAAKARIFMNTDVAVINADDPVVAEMDSASAKILRFGRHCTNCVYTLRDGALFAGLEPLMRLDELGLPGLHNALNGLAATAMAESVGVSRKAIVDTLREFRGLPHRMQTVTERDGVRFVDDSKGTNVGATVAALEGLTETVVLVAGGDGKGQDFSPLRRAFGGRVRHAVLIGRDRVALADAIAGVCTVEFAQDMDQAVAAAGKAARHGDIVLLSPACASLDMYRDYAERGNAFAAAAMRFCA